MVARVSRKKSDGCKAVCARAVKQGEGPAISLGRALENP